MIHQPVKRRQARAGWSHPRPFGVRSRHPHGGGTVVDIGFDIGPKLFDAWQAASEATPESSQQVRPHIRRAHWHTYWTGPRDNPTADVRWLHPILVRSADRDRSRAVVIDADHSD
ncbi:hypothetical protein [Nocardia nova]|uniref:hypothetical protein n=1 Tax=Nocardia nova TaxID=37330 RepID=UPI0015E471AC|nr:hypothetical protein [Nocardia nova]